MRDGREEVLVSDDDDGPGESTGSTDDDDDDDEEEEEEEEGDGGACPMCGVVLPLSALGAHAAGCRGPPAESLTEEDFEAGEGLVEVRACPLVRRSPSLLLQPGGSSFGTVVGSCVSRARDGWRGRQPGREHAAQRTFCIMDRCISWAVFDALSSA